MRMNDCQMREYVIQLVRRKIKEHGLPERPGWKETVIALGLPAPISDIIPQDGLWVSDKRQIIYSSRLISPERIEFTVFHETVHYLIEDDGELLSQLAEYFADDSTDEKSDYVLEALCNRGAGEFIVPSGRFLPMLQELNWKATGIGHTARHFGCSVIAAAFQFALHHPKACCLAICEMGVPRGGKVEDLHVAYTVCSHAVRFPMYRYEIVPKHHMIHQAWLDSADTIGKAVGFYRSRKSWPMDCEVVCLGERAYAAFFERGNTSHQQHPHQLSMF